MKLDALFDPRSVAVVGATEEEGKVGYALMKNVLAGSGREVYPVTLNKTKVFGKKAYKSLSDIPGSIDCVVIAIRADFVGPVLRQAGEKGVKSAVVITAGFKEVGEEGKKMEEELAAIAAEYGIALLGPNCLGVMNAQVDWNASFGVEKPLKGNISFFSQSGAIGTALLDWANQEGVGFAKFASLGNEAQLSELEMLEYALTDKHTEAVLLYIEQIQNGAAFLAAAKKLAAKKPLVVLRAGRSARGSVAVSSHTGSLAPSDEVFAAALRQNGAITVESLRELFSVAKLLSLGIHAPHTRLAIVTNGGGPSVNAADLIGFSHSLELVDFSSTVKKELKKGLPPMAAVGNPIDVIGDADSKRYIATLDILVKQKNIDAIMVLVTPQMMTDAEDIAHTLPSYHKKKPIIPVLMGGRAVEKGREKLKKRGMATFDMSSDVIYALDALARGQARTVSTALHASAGPSSTMLHLDEMQTLLSEFGLTLEGEFVKSGEELPAALERLGEGPYAMKAISQQLVHKSDLKAVQLGLMSKEDLERAWGEIYAYTQAHTEGAVIDGMLVQKMAKGTEVIIGMKRDATFGPTILFGLGGIFVEILKDAALRVAPVSKSEALEQIREIKSFPLLDGARGREPVNLDALAEIIVNLSKLALKHPEIQEIDFNPVFATPIGAHIVDARVMV